MDGSSVIGQLHSADQEITLLINGWTSPWADSFWMMMSDKLFWIPAYLVCVYFLFARLGWKKALIVLASAAIAFAVCDQLSNIVKHAVIRLRPSYSVRMLDGGLNVLEKRGGFYGFFSAHAANAFAIAVCLTMGFRNDRSHTYNAFSRWAIIWATLVAVSRIFVGKHYLGDVIVGTVIGVAVGCSAGIAARYLIDKLFPIVPEGLSPSGSPLNPSQGS